MKMLTELLPCAPPCRREVGEGEEIAVVLRKLIDQALRDGRPDLAALHRAEAAAGDDDRIVAALGDVGLREVEVEHGILRDVEREFVRLTLALRRRQFETISAHRQGGEIVAAVRADGGGARQAGVDVDRGDLGHAALRLHRAAERRAGNLGVRRGSDTDCQRGAGAAPCERRGEPARARPARGHGLKFMRNLHGNLPFCAPTFPALARFADRPCLRCSDESRETASLFF